MLVLHKRFFSGLQLTFSDHFVVTAELRNALPDMVVEILQEKLHRKNNDDVSQLPAMSTQPSLGSTDNVSASCSTGNKTSARHDDGLNEFPKNWEPMNNSEVCLG